MSGTNTITQLVTVTNSVTIGSDSGRLIFNAANSATAGTAFTGTFGLGFTGAGDTEVSGIIASITSLTKTGAGTLFLSGANSFTTATTISNGVVRAANNTALGTVAGGVRVVDGAALEMTTNNAGGNITIGAEALNLSGTGIGDTGALRNITGNNTYGGTITNTLAARINSDAGLLTLSGAINATNQLLTFGGAGNITVSGAITNSTQGLTKDGAGTLILSTATNSYGGVTTIEGGVLQVTNLANAGVNSAIGTSGTIILSNGGVFSYAGTSNSAMNRGINLAGDGEFRVSNTVAAVTNSGVISNTGNFVKTGAGTLVLSASNSFSGTTTVSAGVLSLSSSNALSGSTLDYSGAGRVAFSNLTAVNLGGLQGSTNLGLTNAANAAVALNVGANNSSTTYSGQLGGSGSLNKVGTGTLTLSGANTNTGTTTISSGALNIQNGGGLGTTTAGTTVASGAALELQGGITVGAEPLALSGTGVDGAGALRNISGNNIYQGTITNTAAARINSDAGLLTLSGAINATNQTLTFGGAGNITVSAAITNSTQGLTKDGAGTLILGGANTYRGGTTINEGTIAISNGASFGSNSITFASNGTTVASLASVLVTNNYVLTGNGTMDVGAFILTNSGAVSGAGSLTKAGAGTLILSASNSYSGGTLLNAGTLVAGNLSAFGTNLITINSGVLNLSNLNVANLIINNGGTLTNLGTVSGAELNGGTTTLSASNNTVAEVSGTATVNVSGANTTITNMSGGTVNATTNITVQTFNGGNISNSAAVTIDAGNSSGSISGAGSLIKVGTGTLALSGSNSFTGATVISNGVVSISTNVALAGTTQVQLNNGTVLEYTGGSATLDRNISVTNGSATIGNAGSGTLALSGTLDKNGTELVFAGGAFNITGTITGAGANSDLVVDGASVTLNNTNSYNGPTYIRNGGTLTAAVVGAMPTGTRSEVAIDDTGTGSSTLAVTADQQIASLTGAASSAVSLGTNAALTVGTASGNATFAGVISGSGRLAKDGASTLTLTGANTYTGSTTIAGGTLSVSADNNLGAAPGTATAGSLTLSNGTLLATGGFTLDANRGIALGTGGGTINVASGQNLAYAGHITGANTFAKTGAGTLTLSSSNAYTGMNTLSAGTLRAENAFALGSLNAGDSVTLAGARLELAANSGTTFGAGTGYGTIVSGNSIIVSDRLTVGAGVAQQIGTLSIGAQTLTVEKGANVTGGTATVAIGGATILTGNATFATAAGTQLLFDNTISGAFNITKTGDGILTLNRGGGQADNTITAGQLNINHFQALGTSPGTLTLAGGVTLDNTSGNSVTVGNAKSIALGSSLNFLGSTNLNLGAGTATLSTNVTIDVVANTLAFNGDMTGAFGLTKTGAGTLELAGLTGSNSFTGNSFINGGELFLSGTSVFGGTTNTTVTVGTNSFLRIGASAGLGNVTLVLDNPDGLILASIITNNVVFSNSGTISSTYANVDGSITIGSGVTMSTAANYLGTIPTTNTPGRIVMDDNATLVATTSFTINQNQGITLEPGTANFSSGTNVQLFIASSIAGDGELRKTGAGNVRLLGSNSYTGGTLIDQGIIGITSDSSLGAVTGRVKLNNGTLVAAQGVAPGPTNYTGTTVNSSRTLVLGNGTTNNIDAQTGLFFEYNGVIGEEDAGGAAAALRFGIAGTREGTVKLGGLNTYDGATTIVAGTLEAAHLGNGGAASSIGQSGNAASNLVIGGTLRYTGTNASTDRLFSIGSSGVATIDSGSGSLAFNNTGAMGYAATNLTRHDIALTGTGTGTLAVALVNDVHDDPLHVAKNGTGTWILSGSNDYTGTTTISGGTLQVSSDANLGRTTAGEGLVFNGGTLKTTGSFTNSRVVSMTGAGTVDTDGNTLRLSGVVSGSGALTKSGAGTLTLSAANSFSGGTVLNAGTLRVQNAGALGSGALTQSSNSTLVIDTTGTVANAMSIYNITTLQSVTLSGAKTLNNATFDVAANTTYTETGVLSGDGGIDKIGAGTLVLAGSTDNTYTGATVVEAGALVLSNSAGNAINNSSSITVDSGASLILGASNQIGDGIGLVLNGGTFIVGTATAGYSETLGTLTLNANSTIDLGSYSTGLRQLTFADSHAVSWATNAVLTITNWQGMTRSSSDVAEILFGTGGLTSTQLGQIYFANQNVEGGLLIGGNGELVPIPEAEVYWAALAIALAVGWRERRRLWLILRPSGGGLPRHANPTKR